MLACSVHHAQCFQQSGSKFLGQCCPQGSLWGRDVLHVWSVGPGRFSELWAASFPSGSIGGVPFSRQLPWAAQLPGHVSFQGCDEMTGKLAMISLFSVIFSSFHHEGKVHIAAMQQPPLPVLLSPAGAKQGHPLTLVSCVGRTRGHTRRVSGFQLHFLGVHS